MEERTSYTAYTVPYSSHLTAVTFVEGATRRHGVARRVAVIHAPQGGTRIRRPPVKDSFVAYRAPEVTSRPTDLIADTLCRSRHGFRLRIMPASSSELESPISRSFSSPPPSTFCHVFLQVKKKTFASGERFGSKSDGQPINQDSITYATFQYLT